MEQRMLTHCRWSLPPDSPPGAGCVQGLHPMAKGQLISCGALNTSQSSLVFVGKRLSPIYQPVSSVWDINSKRTFFCMCFSLCWLWPCPTGDVGQAPTADSGQ